MLNGLCWDDDYTIAQWLEHRWLQARVPGSSPGGDSQFFLQTFPVCLFPSNQLIIIIILELRSTERAEPTFHKGFYCFQKTSGYEGSEEHGRKKKCDMEKNDEQKICTSN